MLDPQELLEERRLTVSLCWHPLDMMFMRNDILWRVLRVATAKVVVGSRGMAPRG